MNYLIWENEKLEIKTKKRKVPENTIEKWQNIVDIMVKKIGVTDALITRVTPPYIEVFQASQNKENPFNRRDKVKLTGHYCEVVVKNRKKLLVSNALENDNWKDSIEVEKGMISYLGFPLKWPDGDIFGTICVHDTEENEFSKDAEELIKQFQELVESHLKILYQKEQLDQQIEKEQKIKERLELVMDASEHGFWDWDLDTGEVYFSPRYYTMLGYKPGELPMKTETWINLIHPNDRKKIILKIEEYIENAQPFEEEFRMKCKDCSYKWISGRIKSFEIDKEGNPHRAVGVHVDITKHKKDERKLRNQKEELKDQKEELQALNEQLTAYSEEVATINQELNELNNRFINMINVISNLNEGSKSDEKGFLADLLHRAVNIIPEADYGKIYIVDEDGYCNFIDAIGHDIDILKKSKMREEIFFCDSGQSIYILDEYSLNIDKIPDGIKQNFISALKPVSQSIYINITVNDEVVGKIILDIAEDSNQEFSNNTKEILSSLATLASVFFSFQRYNKLQGQFTKDLITSIIQMLEIYDRYTSGHSENVAQIASKIAEEMGLSQRKITDAYWAGMVHDIGKLLIPLNILNKKGTLSDSEYELIKNIRIGVISH